MIYYTYAYLREDGTPYYIGKGTRRRIHSKLHAVNLPPEERRIFLKTGLTAEEAERHEIYLIAVLGRKDLGTGILRNITDGGEGCAGRVVSDPSQCSKPIDIKKRITLRKTKARMGARMARKAQKTKRFNPASKAVQRLNKVK